MTALNSFEEKVKSILTSVKESIEELAPYVNDEVSSDYPEYPLDIEEPQEPVVGHQEQPSVEEVPVERPPKFRVYWRGWKEGNNTSGQTESVLETAQMARAEAMTKLYDLGFDNIEILAIETITTDVV